MPHNVYRAGNDSKPAAAAAAGRTLPQSVRSTHLAGAMDRTVRPLSPLGAAGPAPKARFCSLAAFGCQTTDGGPFLLICTCMHGGPFLPHRFFIPSFGTMASGAFSQGRDKCRVAPFHPAAFSLCPARPADVCLLFVSVPSRIAGRIPREGAPTDRRHLASRRHLIPPPP